MIERESDLPFQLWHWELVSEGKIEETSSFASKTVIETIEDAAEVVKIIEFDVDFEIRIGKCKSSFDLYDPIYCVCHAE